MNIRRSFEKIREFADRRTAGRRKRSLLVALSVLLSLNIILASVPGAVFANADGIDSLNELLDAISKAKSGEKSTISLSGGFDVYDTIVVDGGKNIVLNPSWGTVTLKRSESFKGELFEVRGSAGENDTVVPSTLTIGSGVVVDGNSVDAAAPLVTVDDSGAFTLSGTLQNNNNAAADSKGGAVYAAGGSVVSISGGSVLNNKAYTGGGIYADASNVEIKDGKLNGNKASYMGGGAYVSASAVSISGSGTGTDSKVDYTTTVSENSAPIGAGIYLCGDSDMSASKAVYIDGNTTDSSSALALPDDESNVLIESKDDNVSFSGLYVNSRVGLYPMENGTEISCDTNYIGRQDSVPVFYDHDAELLKSKTTFADGKAKIDVGDKVTVLRSYDGGSVSSDMGQEISRGQVYPGFPVHLAVSTADGYELVENSFVVKNTSKDTPELTGTAANGMWYTFQPVTAGSTGYDVVEAGFVQNASLEASVNGVNYATLAQAVAACAGRPSAEITLLKDDIALGECIDIPAGSSITINRKLIGKDAQGKDNYADQIVRSALVDNGSSEATLHTGSLFDVPANSELILSSIVLHGNGERIKEAAPLVTVSGKLVMEGTSRILYANGTEGGAVRLNNGTLHMKSGSSIDNNTARKGAGVYMTGSESLLLGDGLVTSNEIGVNSYSVCGGGVYMEGGTVSGCDISANIPVSGTTETTMGGGVYAVSGQIVNSTIGMQVDKDTKLSNVADIGAGIYAVDLAMKDVVVTRNQANEKAGGVFYEDDLAVSGLVRIAGNTEKAESSTAPSNLYFNTASGKPVRLSGRLSSGTTDETTSLINVYLSTGNSAADGKDIIDNNSVADSVYNLGFVKLDNSTSNIVVTDDDIIELADANECITVTLKKDADSGSFETTPACDKAIKLKKDGKAAFVLDKSYSNEINFTISDETAIAVTESDEEDNVYIISTLSKAEKGKSYTVTIDTSYDYEQKSVSAVVPVTNVGSRYDADNDEAKGYTPSVKATYSASKMNPYTDKLEATYVEWGSGDLAVRSQIGSARESQRATDSFDGYIVLKPVMTTDPGDGATALGDPDDVPYVTVSLNVSAFADEGDYIDVVSYNGETSTDNKGKAVLNKDLLVRNGEVTFDVKRAATGSATDVIYVALLNHDDYAASIETNGETKKYHTLEEAFAAAEKAFTETKKTGQEIEVLRDCVINSALVVPTGAEFTLSSDSGAVISRSEFYDGAMVFVNSGAQLTVENIVLDGGAEIVSTSPVTNRGTDADAAVLANHGTLSVSGSSGIENGCHKDSFYGGAFYNSSTGKAVIKDAVFAGNYSCYGGAVYNAGELQLDSCVIRDNTARTSGGGIHSVGKLELSSTTVSGNKCNDPGAGGVYSEDKLIVNGSTSVTNNTDGSGNICNVINAGDEPIVINKALSSSARIGISEPQKSGAVIAVGDGTTVKDASGYKNRFFPDSGNLTVTSTDKKVVYDSKTTTYVVVSLSSGANGTISPTGDVRVKSGDDLAVTVTPNVGYAVADILVDGESVLEDEEIDESTGAVELTLNDVKANAKVEATFKRAPGSVISPSASTGGTISPSGKINVNSEESVDFTLTPDSGYYLETLKLSGKDVLDKAKLNSDGSYTYTVSGITDETANLTAEFKPIYSVRTLVDDGSGVQVKGSIHYKAYLTVENLAEYYPSLYNQMKSALTNDKTITQFIAQAYEIKLNFENEQDMVGSSKIKPNTSVEITFNLGDSYKGKTVRIFHGVNNTIDKTTYLGVIDDTGKFSIATSNLSPFAVVIQEKASTSTNGGTTNGGTTNGGQQDDGKGPVSGDYSEPRTIPPIVIVLLVLSSATIIFVVSKYYLPRFIAYLRAKYPAR